MTSEEKSETTISGPLNVVRLEGEVFGIKKVLYVFFDVHNPPGRESNCENIFSSTITTYLINQFRKTNNEYLDFFLEHFPSRLLPDPKNKSAYRQIYILELRKLLSQAFMYDPKEDKVFPSKVFPRVRLHYIDVRDYLFWNILFNQSTSIHSEFMKIYTDLLFSFRPSDDAITQFLKNLNNFADGINLILNLFFGQKGGKQQKRTTIKQIGEEISDEELHENALKLIQKIKEKYVHAEVKKVMLLMLHEFFEKGLLAILDKINKVNELLEDLSKLLEINFYEVNPSKPIYDEFTNLPKFVQMGAYYYGPNFDAIKKIVLNISFLVKSVHEIATSSSSILVDTYFLRRFLDKDYITNGISYTGVAHSIMYIYILTKYFDFKVTHASYSKYNIDELNDVIKKTDIGYDFEMLFVPSKMYQCSDITDFPDGFS